MKKFTLSILTLVGLVTAAVAQTPVTDSIRTGVPGTAYFNDIYYSFREGQVKSDSNSNWQLAFSIGNFNVGIRANTVTSSAGTGSVTVYEQPGKDTSTWGNFDTTGFTTWKLLDNSDQVWEMGALNVNAQGQFDYGWGAYDPATHNVVGNTIYLVKIKTGATSFEYKKLIISDKAMGVWHVKFANVDGSNEQAITMASADYAGKNFVYLSLLTGAIKDREPDNAAWDFVLTRYKALQPDNITYYPTTGILTNNGVLTSDVRGKDETTTTIADTVFVNGNISEIGYDWKKLSGPAFVAVDSVSFFVQAVDGAFWKLVFNSFDLTNGSTVFTKTKLTNGVGVATVGSSINNLTVYPNPSSDMMNVLMDVKAENSVITITDLTGKTLLTDQVAGSGFKNHAINVSSFAKGIYLLNVENGTSRSVQKIVIN